jgi:ribonucleotide reductase alpha subunit
VASPSTKTSTKTPRNPTNTPPIFSPTGLRVQRYFTQEGVDPFSQFNFVHRVSRIATYAGEVIFEMDDVEVPDFWDQTAVDILASKYFRKTGVPQYDAAGKKIYDGKVQVLGSESSLKQTASRLANTWRLWGLREGYFASMDDANAYRDEMLYMLVSQMAAPNSPVWFNVGLFESYGIVQDPDGSWYFDPELAAAVRTTHRYERAAVNACFAPGTRVLTSTGLVEIENVGVGTLVYTHANRLRPVTAVSTRAVKEDLLDISVEGLSTPLRVTTEHPFYVATAFESSDTSHENSAWIKAGLLEYGDELVTYDTLAPADAAGQLQVVRRRVTRVDHVAFEGDVHNLQVEEDETYCVQGVIVHNCFISNLEDKLVGEGSIFEFAEREARLFSQGSGSGVNMSKLRAIGEPLSGGGVTSGVMSFMNFLDRGAGAIKSGGTTRRAAKMVILDADHPEVEAFVGAKAHEEKKAAALIAAGYDGSYEGEAVQTVAFQNANHSVRITPGFMKTIAEDGDWILTNRRDGSIAKTIKARDLWDQIAQAAWECADPGLQFDDIINDWNTAADTERLRGTNPCFPASARVHTDRGLISFGDLIAGTQRGESYQVYTFDETNADEPVVTVTLSSPDAFIITGVNPIVALEFANGAVLRCTPSHKIFTTNRGFVSANELAAEDRVKVADLPTPPVLADYSIRLANTCRVSAGQVVPSRYMSKNVTTTLPSKWTPELAHLLGWLTGDGSINLSGRGNTCTTWVYGNDVDRYDILPLHKPIINEILGANFTPTELDNGTTQVRANRRPLIDFLFGMGFSAANAPQKRAPEAVFHVPQDILAGYLRGLFDADGTVISSGNGTRYVGLDSSSPELLRDVQKLLVAFGITSSIYQTGKDGRNSFTYTTVSGEDRYYTAHAMYSLRITAKSIPRYAALIGFNNSDKANNLLAMSNMTRGFYDTDTSTSLVALTPEEPEVTYNLSEPRNHSYVVDGIVVRNCSEYVHVDDTACNLASLNLVKFYDDASAYFDDVAFEHAVRLWTLTLEIAVSMSHYPAKVIAERSYQHRTLGLGYANLGALLMRAGLAYDSPQARAATGAVTALMHNRAYATSVELARAVGPAEAWKTNKDSMARVLRNHRRAAYGSQAAPAGLGDYEGVTVIPMGVDHNVLDTTPFANLSEPVRSAADDALEGVETGYRNTQVTVLAPTGCVTADTQILTDQGTFALGTLGDPDGPQWQELATPGLQAITDEGSRPITKFFVNGYAEVVCVESEDGRRLRGTPEHRIKVMTPEGHFEWRRLAEVRAGDAALVWSERFSSVGTATIARDAYLDGSDLTYDLSVPDNVTYIANGFVSHNTIGLVMSCDTTGVEPDFALVKEKKLAGGGRMRIINSSVRPALVRLGYTPDQITRIFEYALGTQSLRGTTPINRTSLQGALLDAHAIDAAEAALTQVSDITWAFERHIIGHAAYSRLPEETTGYDLLRTLGFSDEQIAASSTTICGHLTVEGAPDLKDEHLAVFDCAVECGDGTRSIAWTGHVGALAAVAPHLSGSASKTVNLPSNATVSDIEEAYRAAYHAGVKCIAIYRDGSKVAQPLSSAGDQGSEEDEDDTMRGDVAPLRPVAAGTSPSEYYGDQPPPRFRPPNPRRGLTWRVTVAGEELYMHVNHYEDGTVAEIFIDWGRQGSTLRGMTSALSIAISHALQHGTPLENIVNAYVGQSFEPFGPVAGHANLKWASSVPDAIARILGHQFLGRNDLVQVKGPPTPLGLAIEQGELTALPTAESKPEVAQAEASLAHAIIRDGGGTRIYGKNCSSCGGSDMRRAGTCYVCGSCGNTTGCS